MFADYRGILISTLAFEELFSVKINRSKTRIRRSLYVRAMCCRLNDDDRDGFLEIRSFVDAIS